MSGRHPTNHEYVGCPRTNNLGVVTRASGCSRVIDRLPAAGAGGCIIRQQFDVDPVQVLLLAAETTPPRPGRGGVDPGMPRSVEERLDEVVAVLGVDAPGVIGAVAGGTKAEGHHGDDLVGVVDQHRSARVTKAGSALASDSTRVVQGVQVAALGDVAVDLDDS